MAYTTVLIQSVKADIAGDGLQIVLVAQGAGLPDVPDVVRTNGGVFDPLILRRAAVALLLRLNANLAALATMQALVGTHVDVTSPLPPEGP
jgi:hypothetical protein